MLPPRVRAVFIKELRDALRDRRTVFATVFVPLLLWPLMLLGVAEATQFARNKIRGETYIVAVPRSTVAFFERLAIESDVEQAAENPPKAGEPEKVIPKLLFQGMRSEESAIALANGQVRAVIAVPRDIEERMNRFEQISIEVRFDQAEQRSIEARARVVAILERIRDKEIGRRLKEKNLTREFIKPLDISSKNIAAASKVGGSILGSIIPLLFIMMIVTGAVHPAIDMTAGEKERSTLETLIGAPVRPIEIITGKFLAVSTLALSNGALNVASFGLTFFLLPRAQMAEMQFPWEALPLSLMILLPLALFFSALLLAVASFGANQKEAQIYCLPIYFLPVIGTMVVSMPGIELEGPLLFAPVINTALLIKELFLGRGTAHQISFVFLSTCFYAAAAVTTASRVFAREEVLFSAQGSLRLFLSRRFFKPSDRPRSGDAMLAIAILFPVNFFFQLWLTSMLFPDGNFDNAARAILLIAVPQIVLFLGVPILLSRYLKTKLDTTFAWRMPPMRSLLAACLIGGSTWLLAQQVISWQSHFWPYNPADGEKMYSLFKPIKDIPGGVILLSILIGVLPGICEEHLFRGFFMQGMRNSGKWTAIMLSGVIFGIYHMQLFNQPLLIMLGIVLAYMTWQSRSIWPAVLAHLLHNGLQILIPHLLQFKEEKPKLGEPLPGMPLEVLIPATVAFVVGLILLRSLSGKEEVAPTRMQFSQT